MKLVEKAVLILLVFCFNQNILAVTPKFFDDMSTMSGGFIWGSSWWQTNTYHEYQYAETSVTTAFTAHPERATHLNCHLSYSQVGSAATVMIWIATQNQLPIDIFSNNPHYHHSWWNFNERTEGGYSVATLTVPSSGNWLSVDISSWLAQNPSNRYYITFYINTGQGDDVACNAVWLGSEELGTNVMIGTNPTNPGTFQLSNHPNPFNPSTTIKYYVDRQEPVTIQIFNSMGQAVRTLSNAEQQAIGEHEIEWNGRDDFGQQLPTGTYMYKISTETSTSVSRMSLVK